MREWPPWILAKTGFLVIGIVLISGSIHSDMPALFVFGFVAVAASVMFGGKP